MAQQTARIAAMALYTIEALADEVEVKAIWWKRATVPYTGPQGNVIGVGGCVSWDQTPLYLNTGDVEKFVAQIGKVNDVPNPPLPQTVEESTVIAGVLRVTRISDAERPSDADFD